MRRSAFFVTLGTIVSAGLLLAQGGALSAYQPRPAPAFDAATGITSYPMSDGSIAKIGRDGLGWRALPDGRHGRPIAMLAPRGKDAIGGDFGPGEIAIQRSLLTAGRGLFPSGRVIVVFQSGVSVVGALTPARDAACARGARTNDYSVNSALRSMGTTSLSPLFGCMSRAALSAIGAAARTRLGSAAIDPSNAYVARIAGADPRRAVALLRALPSVRYAEPDWYVGSLDTNPRPLPAWALRQAHPIEPGVTGGASLPTNYGLTSSFQSHLNANGVDAVGAFAEIQSRFGQLPGQGETVTNVSIGDLMDEQMIQNGDQYAAFYGPDSELIGSQRYLDFPALPLIPTYVADQSGTLSGSASVEHVDPFLSEVLLDFSVMAPLPHDRQRAGEQGSTFTDLLGVAPGAQYRLVVPQQPTIANIDVALLAAALQQPRPDVITASLGFGFDSTGFPGRYLEEDPLAQAIVTEIVQDYRIVVCISANDGTRTFTPASIGPDGGSAPTDVAPPGSQATNVGDDAQSTIPSLVYDSGALDVGGSTTDDTIAAPPHLGGTLSQHGAFPETRTNGETDFSSGFGARVNVSAPSDNIPALVHECTNSVCTPHDVVPVLDGGTSASAPMTAAAAAVVLQVARLTGHSLAPEAVRTLLAQTGNALPDQPQADRHINVGPQIDVGAAVASMLDSSAATHPAVVRLSVAERQDIGNLGALFLENTDPSFIDLSGPVDVFGDHLGQNVVSPITIAADVVNLPGHVPVAYDLRVGSGAHIISHSRATRLLPATLFAAAGVPLVSTAERSIPIRFDIREGTHVVASMSKTLTFGPDTGVYAEALAPGVAAVVPANQPVTVSFDLRNVKGVDQPRLIISSIGHWTPATAALFHPIFDAPISGSRGTIAIPASLFTGGGVYGAGILSNTQGFVYGEFVPFRVSGSTALQRPDAPLLAAGSSTVAGHFLTVTRFQPGFELHFDVSRVSGAAGAVLEISAPSPTLLNLFNTFTNQNGTGRDHDGADTPSTVYLPLGGVSGVQHFDAVALGLTSSDVYTVRVLATGGGSVVGQASTVSSLEYDDGFTPGGEPLVDFDVNPGGTSVVSTAAFDSSGNPVDAGLFGYDASTGTYGAQFAHDPTGATVYTLFGHDASLGRTIAQQYQWFGTQQWVESYDDASGALAGSVPVDSAAQYFIVGGRVDALRHSAQVLAYDPTGADTDLPFALQPLALGKPIKANDGTRRPDMYNAIDIDEITGEVFFADALTGDACLFLGGQVTSVSPVTGNARRAHDVDSCMTGIAADQLGNHVYVTNGPLIAFPDLLPEARYQTIGEMTLDKVGGAVLDGRSSFFPVVDPLHHLMLIAFTAPSGFYTNNNAMSQIGVVDLRTGYLVNRLNGFNFINEAFGNNNFIVNERGIQIDPATRTGWVYGPEGLQVQRFSY